MFSSLNVNKIDSLVLACKLEPSAVLSGLQNMWSVIEELAEQKKFEDVGVSDIDTDIFVNLYNWAKVSHYKIITMSKIFFLFSLNKLNCFKF